jgi:hypothetical protein
MTGNIPNSLIERLNTAGQLSVRAKIFYDVWRCYYDELNREDQFHYTVNLYTEFFRFDYHAHLMCFVLSYAALLEPRGDTINLGQLVKDTLDVAAVLATERTEINDLLDKILKFRSPIMMLRNNAFAHRSASLSYNSAFKKAQITPNELRELSDDVLKLTNRLLIACNLKDKIANTMAVDDLLEIVGALHKQHLSG